MEQISDIGTRKRCDLGAIDNSPHRCYQCPGNQLIDNPIVNKMHFLIKEGMQDHTPRRCG